MQSSRLAYKAVRLACALSFAIPSPVHASILDDPATLTTAYVYEARMGPLVAGELNFDFQRADADYRFLGRFVSSRSLSKYYTWNGTFAAQGSWREQRPKTKTYLVQSESTDDDYKVVIMGEQQTQVLLERGGEFAWFPPNWPWERDAPANAAFFVLRNGRRARAFVRRWCRDQRGGLSGGGRGTGQSNDSAAARA